MSARAVIAVRIARALRGTVAASISTTTGTGTTGGAGCGSETD
ncbi:MAG: hypothetical protein ACOY82_13330 [Pseudomonadota bacterium]